MNMLWKMTEPKYDGQPGSGARPGSAVHPARRSRAELRHQRHARGGQFATPIPTPPRRAAIAALSGPLHGGANEEVLRMLDEIGSKDNIPAYIEQVKAGKRKLMGFGHRVYKNYDPRARIIKQVAEEVFEVTGRNPKLDIALELEHIALEDDYFVKRKLYPNVDFYSGIIYQAMGFTPDMFTVLFAIPRTVGWLAQWQEMLQDRSRRSRGPGRYIRGKCSRRRLRLSSRTPHGRARGKGDTVFCCEYSAERRSYPHYARRQPSPSARAARPDERWQQRNRFRHRAAFRCCRHRA